MCGLKLIENFEWMNAERNKMNSKPAYNLTVFCVQRLHNSH